MIRIARVGASLFLVAATTLANPQPATTQSCEVVARLDNTTLKHAAAGAGIYAVSRAVGVGDGGAFVLGFGANLAKEFYDRCRTGFDVGDLAGGLVGTSLAWLVDRALGGNGQAAPRGDVVMQSPLGQLRFSIRILPPGF